MPPNAALTWHTPTGGGWVEVRVIFFSFFLMFYSMMGSRCVLWAAAGGFLCWFLLVFFLSGSASASPDGNRWLTVLLQFGFLEGKEKRHPVTLLRFYETAAVHQDAKLKKREKKLIFLDFWPKMWSICLFFMAHTARRRIPRNPRAICGVHPMAIRDVNMQAAWAQ